MSDLYIIVFIIAVGFAYMATKLNKIIDIASLSVSMQLGKVIGEKLDDDTYGLSMKDDEDE